MGRFVTRNQQLLVPSLAPLPRIFNALIIIINVELWMLMLPRTLDHAADNRMESLGLVQLFRG